MDYDWQQAVLNVLGDHFPEEVSLQTIYHEIGKYRKLSDFYYEITKHKEPRYQHIVRATLRKLKKDGCVENLRRGVYILKE